MAFNSESDPMDSKLFSVVGAAAPEFVALPLSLAGVGNAASVANAGGVALVDASLFFITARATSTPAAASTMTPITQRFLPGVLVVCHTHGAGIAGTDLL